MRKRPHSPVLSTIMLGGALLFAAFAASAAETGHHEVKVPRPLQSMEDIKTDWTPPPKPDAGDDEEVPVANLGTSSDGAARKILPDVLANVVPAIDLNQLYIDHDAGSGIWVRGEAFKAHFDVDQVTYVPFLGSDAPRNEPVSFRLESLSIGGRVFELPRTALPRLVGNRIVFDHGIVHEVYELSSGGIEQMFVLPEPVGPGELLVNIAVSTDLGASEEADHLTFSNERGAVSYSRAIAFDQAGLMIPAPTRLTDTGIEIRVAAADVAAAMYPLVIDPVISTFFISGSVPTDQFPDVAFDLTSNRYIVVWERNFSATDGDIWAQLHDSSGTLIANTGAYIDFTTANWRRGRVANNRIASQFLVAAQVGLPGSRIIRGRTRDAGSTTMGSQFTISGSESGEKINVDVGGDPHPSPPTYYCVVWERIFTLNVDHDIHMQLVRSNSTLLNASTILLDNSLAHDRHPSISKSNGQPPASTQEWTIVWQRRWSATDEDIYGAQVHWDGNVTHSTFLIDFAAANDERPTVSSILDGSGPRPYLVAYERGLGTDRDIRGQVRQGTTQITSANLTAIEGAPVGQNQIQPHADSDGETFTVAYAELWSTSQTDYDVYVATFCLHGSKLYRVEGHLNLAFSSSAENQPRIVARHSGGATGRRFMSVWTDFSGTFGGIEGALYDSRACCPADLAPATGNGVVNVFDLLFLLSEWGMCTPGSHCPSDFNGDGTTNVFDLLFLLGEWGMCP